ncbi:hypothetical protein HN358_00100 [Candidatus Uhrbacteria bacterium]|jgi:hypothetical protein|nr:hypothetical protein [Candidatus Uhrbacteria bacterium]MBT7717250.1 hypothetical protein [Candidatus Uhrbacteria bacterium]
MTIKVKKIIGIVLMVFPIPLLIITLVAYAIISFILSAVASSGDPEVMMVFGNVVRLVLGIFGLLGMLGIFIGLPVGAVMYFSARKQERNVSGEDQVASAE